MSRRTPKHRAEHQTLESATKDAQARAGEPTRPGAHTPEGHALAYLTDSRLAATGEALTPEQMHSQFWQQVVAREVAFERGGVA